MPVLWISKVRSGAIVCGVVVAMLAVDALPPALAMLPPEIAVESGEEKATAKPAIDVCYSMACSTGDPSVPCCCTDTQSDSPAVHAIASLTPCPNMGTAHTVATSVSGSRNLPEYTASILVRKVVAHRMTHRIGTALTGIDDLPDRVPIA